MDNRIYTYALINALYNSRKDYIECFLPFIIKELHDGQKRPLDAIQDLIKTRTGLQIPKYSLKTILKRCRKRGYVKNLGRSQYIITQKGVGIADSLTDEYAIQRKLNALNDNLCAFILDRSGKTIDKVEAFDFLRKFVEKNIVSALDYLNPEFLDAFDSDIRISTNYEKYIVEYLEHIRKSSDDHYNTMKEIILGSTLSLALLTPNIYSIEKKFKGTNVFLDSNFTFSVLGFHYEEFAAPAKELFQMLKNYGFKLKIFNITVNEMCSVLNRYPQYEKMYPRNIKVASIYGHLKRKGWTVSDNRDFILSIEEKLAEQKIQIETLADLDVHSYLPRSHEDRETLEQYKPEQGKEQQNHDLIILEQIKKLRRHSVRNIQDTGVLFLTSDLKLAKFNFEYFGHRSDSTISEAIPDFLLTNFLWLQNPSFSTEIPLQVLISAHSQHLFVPRKIWERFVRVIRELKDTSSISDDKVAALLYHGHIEEVLRDIDETECDSLITPDFVLEKASEAAVNLNKVFVNKLHKKDEALEFLKGKLSKKETEYNQKWFRHITEIKDNLRKTSDKKASVYAVIFAIILSAITLVVVIAMPIIYCFHKYSEERAVALSLLIFAAIALIVGSGGLFSIWCFCYKISRSIFSSKLYFKKLKEAGLEKEVPE